MESKGNNKKQFSSDDEASPRAILDAPVSGTESDNSGSSSFSSYSSENSPPVEGKLGWKESNMMQWKSMIDVFKFKSVRRLTAIPLLAAVNNDIAKTGFPRKLARIRSAEESIDIGAIPTKPSWRNFDYDELAAATNDFSSGPNVIVVLEKKKDRVQEVDDFFDQSMSRASVFPVLGQGHITYDGPTTPSLSALSALHLPHDSYSMKPSDKIRFFSTSENLIGKGGHAEVYKGHLSDGQVVAVKRLMKNDKDFADRAGDFLTELGIIAHVNHPNATRLVGFGIDRGLYFVLQLAPYGSLSSLLFGSECLEWKTRYKVVIGVAEGLHYLHEDCPRRIIHRDIKASNILLNDNYEAEISDFGLAKWLPNNWAHHVVFPIEGTFGYLAPEYFMHGVVDEKTDVFAFGVLLLELITGRRAVDSDSKQSLVIWAKPLLDSKNVQELADPRLEEKYDPTEMNRAMKTASLCVHHSSSKRPFMKQVAQLLKGEEAIIDSKHHSGASRSLSLEACDLEDYTCSSYLKDLNRHRELVME